MKIRSIAYLTSTLGLATVLPSVGQNAPAVAAGSTKSETITLSPFEVSTTQDTGYAGQDTLSGSRLRTNLRDVAAAITYDMQEMIMIALEKAGRQLTAEKFIAGLESIQNWQDIFGAPAQTFGPNKRGGTDGFVLTRVEGGKFKRVAVMNCHADRWPIR